MEGQVSPTLQLLSSMFLLLLFICLYFLPHGKGLMKVSLFLYVQQYTSLTLHILHTKMDINRDGMGPFMPTSRSPSSSIALNFSYVDHLRACVDNQLFLLDLIPIIFFQIHFFFSMYFSIYFFNYNPNGLMLRLFPIPFIYVLLLLLIWLLSSPFFMVIP
jgi:hypothetical protein